MERWYAVVLSLPIILGAVALSVRGPKPEPRAPVPAALVSPAPVHVEEEDAGVEGELEAETPPSDVARERGVSVIGLTGEPGGRLRERCDICQAAPSSHTPRIQEMHITIGHTICELLEARVG